MRMSQLFLQTLREAPGDIRLPGHQYLVRAGIVRPIAPGIYGMLPLGMRIRRKLEAAVRLALEQVGGLEIALPHVQPMTLASHVDGVTGFGGRPTRFRDRNQRQMMLTISREGALMAAVRGTLQSYRQLPTLLYTVDDVFSNEERVARGLFGLRERRLVDGYSLHADEASLDETLPRVHDAFSELLAQLGLDLISAEVAVHDAGGVAAQRLLLPLPGGDEVVARCAACGYAADQVIARTRKEPHAPEDPLPMEDVATPNCKTIAELAAFLRIPTSRTAKAVFMVAGFEKGPERFVFAIVRGDTDLSEAKLARALNAQTVGPATEAEIRAMGAEPGYGSPVGLEGVTVVVDELVARSPNLVAGANRPGYHTRNVNLGRDYHANLVADLVLAQEGSHCHKCGAPLTIVDGVALAELARLGDDHAQKTNATYLDPQGQMRPVLLGRYRVDVDRVLGAIAETQHDKHGVLWPASVAPFQVYLMAVGKAKPEVLAAAEERYADLSAAGLEVLYDDRNERAGVKFNDADLLGMPVRVAVGDRGLKNGIIEVKRRDADEVMPVPVNDLVPYVAALCRSL